MLRFSNRTEAGRLLSERLKAFRREDPMIIALPRGGVPIAFEVATALGAPLRVLAVKKIRAPDNPEFGIGAVTESGFYWVDPKTVRALNIPPGKLDHMVRARLNEVKALTEKYRHGKILSGVKDRTVILIDDGLATGVTATVAGEYLRSLGAGRLVLAVPVAASETMTALSEIFDEIICLQEAENIRVVSNWYEDFSLVSDATVLNLIEKHETNQRRTGADQEKEFESGEDIRFEVPTFGAPVTLHGTLHLPHGAKGLVIFAHGSGGNRISPQNRHLALEMVASGMATLLFDLLDPIEALDRQNIFDIPLLGRRLLFATKLIRKNPKLENIPFGFLAASTGAAAALWAAHALGEEVAAIVSRGGRPDLATEELAKVQTPTLLIVGSHDELVREMNEDAAKALTHSKLIVISGATHLFEEPGAIQEVGTLTRTWFLNHFNPESKKDAA